MSPPWNPVKLVVKWHTGSSLPSAFTSFRVVPQKASEASSPVRPKVNDVRSTSAGASKSAVLRMATGIVPLLPSLIELGLLPGLMSMAT